MHIMDYQVFILLLHFVSAIHATTMRDVKRIERRLRTMEDNIAEERIQRREDLQSVMDKLSELQNTLQENHGTKKENRNELVAEKRDAIVLGQITQAFEKEKKASIRFRRDIQYSLQELSSNIEEKLENQLEDIENMSIKLMNNLSEMKQHIAITEGTCKKTGTKLETFRRLGVTTLTTNLNTPSDSECLANLVDKSKADWSSCMELKYAGFTESGVYKIKVKDRHLQVYCDQTTDGGGWIVFQRRRDGSIDFDRTWNEYKHGFGDLEGEFWLGNDNLAHLTETCCHKLRVDLRDVGGSTRFAEYNEFRVFGESFLYKINVGTYSGNAGNSLKYHNKMKFSTRDSDNDDDKDYHCASGWEGGWWFANCHHVFLNGAYRAKGIVEDNYSRIHWVGWKFKKEDGNYYSLTFSEMKFR